MLRTDVILFWGSSLRIISHWNKADFLFESVRMRDECLLMIRKNRIKRRRTRIVLHLLRLNKNFKHDLLHCYSKKGETK